VRRPFAQELRFPDEMLPALRRRFADAFYELPSGCWTYRKRSDLPQRHSSITVCNPTKTVMHAHRVSYAVHNGPIPAGQVVRHKCDFPPCVRPDHLELGSQVDNAMDSVERGRARRARGRDNPFARLNEEQVRQIRTRSFRYGEMSQLARDLGVSLNTIQAIRAGRKWRHVA
jgi:hypothetical protein